ncbi:MAG: bifunctional 4-hydroxy-2-oxoglutarate aldolase/2-dehydro-3-deoxy-phosphogluconate aldolase [Acidaminococcaceae bacterium]|nr:bifunctional 4-hydroxy-2-oxoglutarate aldolase/2-dehydro-3-deoxy-phosphogluconate aldolase [Acidaminococcaceae bacterium]HCJ91464.1 2-dehydro-3-deoxyphosphogluconate aldolase [Acidaminococcaceae bacterium]
MTDVLQKFHELGVVPVVVLDDAKDAEALGKALCDGGLPVAEVTFRTAAAEESIRIMASKFPDMLVGAGTVLTVDQAKRAVAAGAKFIVSPGFNAKVVKYCVDNGIPVTPGIQTPTEIEMALEFGLKVVKFFPAEAAGGLKMIKALAGPYVNTYFMPTGGISLKNAPDYLSYEKIWAVGGSWIAKKDDISAGNFEKIKLNAEEAVALVKAIRP